MKKIFVFAASLAFAAASSAQTGPKNDDHSHALAGPCSGGAEHSQRQNDDEQRDGAVIIPCGADAAQSSTGSLTALQVGAGVAAAAVVAAAISGGDSSHRKQDTPAGTGGTSGTTGTTGTASGAH